MGGGIARGWLAPSSLARRLPRGHLALSGDEQKADVPENKERCYRGPFGGVRWSRRTNRVGEI